MAKALKNKLPISEVFFSIQGEGISTGVPSFFIRLRGCNLLCTEAKGGTWTCDTIDVWRQGKLRFFEEVVNDLGGEDYIKKSANGSHTIFTGGEPMLHQDNIARFIYYLAANHGAAGRYFEVETNGTIEIDSSMIALIHQWNVSPKLSNSGETKERRYKPEVLQQLSRGTFNSKTIFKFVVTRDEDWKEIENDYLKPNLIKRSQIWLMPGADNQTDLTTRSLKVIDICKSEGLKFSSRLQVAIYNQLTGV